MDNVLQIEIVGLWDLVFVWQSLNSLTFNRGNLFPVLIRLLLQACSSSLALNMRLWLSASDEVAALVTIYTDLPPWTSIEIGLTSTLLQIVDSIIICKLLLDLKLL